MRTSAFLIADHIKHNFFMRIIGHIPHPQITITVFSMNDKYQIQFEAGQMIQTYKLLHSEVDGLEGIKKIISESFIEKVIERFNEMFVSFQEAKKLSPFQGGVS